MISRRLFNTGLASTLGFLTQKIPFGSLGKSSYLTPLKGTELRAFSIESHWGSGDTFNVFTLTFHSNQLKTENSYTAIERILEFYGSSYDYNSENIKKTETNSKDKSHFLNNLMTNFNVFDHNSKKLIEPTEIVPGKYYNIEIYNYLGDLICTSTNFFCKSYKWFPYYEQR